MSQDMLGMIPLADALALMGDLRTKLGGRDGPTWFAELKRFLRKEPSWPSAEPVVLAPVTLAPWRTVRLGVHKTVEAYVAALEASGVAIGTEARKMLARARIVGESRDLRLFLGSARDFAFTRNVQRRQLFDRAALHGYFPCPEEAGLVARGQYVNQPEGESLTFATEPFLDSKDRPSVLNLGTYGTVSCLNADHGRPGFEWLLDDVWVWCRQES